MKKKEISYDAVFESLLSKTEQLIAVDEVIFNVVYLYKSNLV